MSFLLIPSFYPKRSLIFNYEPQDPMNWFAITSSTSLPILLLSPPLRLPYCTLNSPNIFLPYRLCNGCSLWNALSIGIEWLSSSISSFCSNSTFSVMLILTCIMLCSNLQFPIFTLLCFYSLAIIIFWYNR